MELIEFQGNDDLKQELVMTLLPGNKIFLKSAIDVDNGVGNEYEDENFNPAIEDGDRPSENSSNPKYFPT